MSEQAKYNVEKRLQEIRERIQDMAALYGDNLYIHRDLRRLVCADAVWLLSEIDRTRDGREILKGELEAIRTEDGIQNAIDQAVAQDRAEPAVDVECCDCDERLFTLHAVRGHFAPERRCGSARSGRRRDG